MRRDGPRDPVTGPESGPSSPFPLKLNGKVVKGFGRGSKELGIPTANIPIAGLSVGGHKDVESGVYYGWAGLGGKEEFGKQGKVYPMVMSIGWNPFYKNTVRSVEVHIMHKFYKDFYGAHMNLLILAFIRPEYDYVSKESLIKDIKEDVEVAKRSLERKAYTELKEDGYLLEFEDEGHKVEVAT
ncbi:MAG: riboflavin kinase [Pycnora praestabilis]|nr:MAG: riboflavin kinase [Pycnora praestabilis]